MPMKTSTKPTRKIKNFVKEQSKLRVSKQAIQKQYIPGIYTHHHPSQCDHKLRNRPIHLKLDNAYEGKELIDVVEPENVRKLLVPSNKINVYPAIWQENELKRLQQASKIVTLEDRQHEFERSEIEKKKLEEECEERKRLFREIDKAKAEKNIKGNQDTSDDEDGRVKVLDRAFLAKQEQEEEVKRANRIILATKCHVIRDAQVAEKYDIQREHREENLRLERMMSEERAKALKVEDEKREEMKQLNARHAFEVKNQLREREMARLLEAERTEEEAKAMARAQIAITLDMMEKEKKKQEQKIKVRNDLRKANELSDFFKRLSFEEQRIAEMRAAEYLKRKDERDKQLAEEKKLLNEQKQRYHDHMLVVQTRMLYNKNDQEEINLRRESEEKERKFREKEKEAAIKKKQTAIELANTRKEQLAELKRLRALQIARDETDFLRVVNKLKDDEKRDKEKEDGRKKKCEKYREEIINQMNSNEMKRREMKRRARNEHFAEIEKDRLRSKNLKNVIKTKIQEMREAKVPEKFIKDVERQLDVNCHRASI